MRKCFTAASVAFATLLLNSSTPFAQTFSLQISRPSPQGPALLKLPSKANSYYVVDRSDTVEGAYQSVHMELGTNVTGEVQYPVTPDGNAFFRAHRVDTPLGLDRIADFDSDGDGIDDLYELTHGLNPLDPSDGPSHLAQYQTAIPLLAYFSTNASSVSALAPSVGLQFYLTKSYVGTVHYQVSGTSVAGVDLQPLSGNVSVNGTSGTIPISLINTPKIESARSIVVTLQMETNKGPYTLTQPTAHRLDLIEGDAGVYAGAMGFTNGVFFGPQPLTVALRSSGGNTGTAYFDTSGCTFFTQPFSMDVHFTGIGEQFQFSGPVSGTAMSANLARTLNWTLTVANPVFTNNIVQASFALSVEGITTATGPLLAKGNLILGLIGK